MRILDWLIVSVLWPSAAMASELTGVSIAGYGLREICLVVAIGLIVADIWFPTDVLTHVAWILISFVVAVTVTDSFLYQVLAGLLAWFALVSFHYLAWSKIRVTIINRYISPERYIESSRGMVGQHGVVVESGGRLLVELRGDRYPLVESKGLLPGQLVEVVEHAPDGALAVRPAGDKQHRETD